VEDGFRQLKIKNWGMVAKDRKLFKKLLREIEAHNGL
jgi:hypothetical protein